MTFAQARDAAFRASLPTSWEARMNAEARITKSAERYLAGIVKPEHVSETVIRWLSGSETLKAVATSSGKP